MRDFQLTPTEPSTPPDYVDGIVTRVVMQKPESGWAILQVDRAGMPESWVGIMPEMREGLPVRATGKQETGGKFGPQFKVQNIVIRMPEPTDGDAVARFLAKLGVQGVGERIARRIVDALGAETIPALEGDVAKVAAVKGVGEQRAQELSDAWKKHSVEGQIMIGLARYGIRAGLAKRVIKRYGGRALEVCEKRPFKLALEVDGIGFKTADGIARAVGIAEDSLERIEAGIVYTISEKFSARGHCFVRRGVLIEKTAEMLSACDEAAAKIERRCPVDRDYEPLIPEGIKVAFDDGYILEEPPTEADPEARIYPSGLHRAEVRVAGRMARLLAAPAMLRLGSEDPMAEHDADMEVRDIVHQIRGLHGPDGQPLALGPMEEFPEHAPPADPPRRAPPPEELAAFAEPAIAAFEASMKMTLADTQKEAVRLALREKVLILTGGPGCGKCLRVGTPVLMFDGTLRPVEDVREGDLLMGPDSKPRRVRGCTRGTGPLFEIRPVKGEPWVCNDVHVLTLVRSGGNMDGRTLDIPLDKYMALPRGAKWRQRGKLFRVGVEFQDQDTFLDPYVMGLWLGDGETEGVRVTKPDVEVAESIEAESIRLGLRSTRTFSEKNGCYDTAIRGVKKKQNPFLDEVRTAKDEHGKFIPDNYKLNSREKRLRLLAGLIDTDGYINSGCCEIISKWRRLTDDMAFLARSLGFAAYVSEKPVQLEGWTEPRTYYRVMISGDLSVVPCKLSRKQSAARLQIKNVLRTGFDVVPIGDGEYAGFELGGDGRFLLGDFTVTHNTATSRAILHALEMAGFKIGCCAPTGRAAKRLQESTKRPASTIHRLLEYKPSDSGGASFTRTASNPLSHSAVLADEMSMTDVSLMANLLDALDDGARIVIVGDVDQLPSVGPGAVLRDMIESGVIPVVRLTQIFRQAEGSQIIVNAHKVNRGELPDRKPPSGLDPKQCDFFWIPRDEAASAAATALKVIVDRLHDRGIATRNCMIVTPQKTGKVGVKALNAQLQGVLNPQSLGKELSTGKIDPVVWRVGDPVRVTKNDYKRLVFNGEVGWIKSVDPDKHSMVVTMDDGRAVDFTREHFDTVIHAYAATGHSMQGGQCEAIIVMMLREHHMLLSRPWLYTSLTRGQKLVVLIADPSAVAIAVSETRRELRNTGLKEKLRAACAKETP